MKCFSCFKDAKFIQKGSQLSFCNKKCQFDYISAGEKRKLEYDPDYVTIIARNGTEFKIERNLVGLAKLEEFSTIPTQYDSDDLYLLFHATYAILYENYKKLGKLMEIADFLDFQNDMILDMYLLTYADYALLYKNREKLSKLKEIAEFLKFKNNKLVEMENLLNSRNLLELVEIVSIEFQLYIEKAAFIVFTDLDDMKRFDNEISFKFNVFNVSQQTLEIFESLTRKDLFNLNLNPQTLCELVYVSVELGFKKFYGELMEYIYSRYKNIRNLIKSTSLSEDNPFIDYKFKYEDLKLTQEIDFLIETKKFKVLLIYNNLLKFVVVSWIKKFFVDQYFTAKYIADKLKYSQDIYEPVREYREGDEFKVINYDLKTIVPYQRKTILNLPDDIITDLLLYLKLEQVPNYEYFVMGFRSSHPRLWKVVSVFMKEDMSYLI